MNKLKKLLLLPLALNLLTSCFGGGTNQNFNEHQNTFLPKTSNIASIGGEKLTNTDVYNFLKQKSGKSVVQAWFKITIVKLVLGESNQKFTSQDSRGVYDNNSKIREVTLKEASGIKDRVEVILKDLENSILFPRNIHQHYTNLGYENLLEYKTKYLKTIAYEELFNEIYIKDNVAKLFDEFQPRKVWVAKFSKASFAEAAIKRFETAAKVEVKDKPEKSINDAWAKEAKYKYADYLRLGLDKYPNQIDKQLGLSGITKSTFLKPDPSVFDAELVGLKGYELNDSEYFPDAIKKVLFDKYIGYDGDPEEKSKGYLEEKGGINEWQMLTYDNEKKYYVEKSDSIWVIRVKVIREKFGDAHEELNWVETKEQAKSLLNDYSQTLRSLGRKDSIISKAQTYLFEKYALEVFDEELWLQISGEILDNKETTQGE